MADGIAVGRPGDVPFGVVQELVDEIATVGEDSLARALLYLLERAKQVVEPAGAAAVAHLMDLGDDADLEGPVVAVISGGNIDPLLMLRIIRTGLTVAGRYLQVRLTVPDRPGSLAGLLARLAHERANVLEVVHGRTNTSLRVHEVQIAITAETEGPEHSERVLRALHDHGYDVELGL